LKRERLAMSARSLAATSGSSRVSDLSALSARKADDPCAHTVQFRSVFFERSVRPRSSTFTQRRVHLLLLTASKKRQLEPYGATFVPCVPVLAFLWRVFPPIRRQQCGTSVVVFQPHSTVEVVVRSRDRSRVKVDCPAAE